MAPSIEDFYDDETWAAIDGWGRRTATAGSGSPVVEAGRPSSGVPGDPEPLASPATKRAPGDGVRVRAVGAVMAGALFTGVAEALEEPQREPDEEFRPEAVDRGLQPVTYFHTPGFPKESVAVVRPWLF